MRNSSQQGEITSKLPVFQTSPKAQFANRHKSRTGTDREQAPKANRHRKQTGTECKQAPKANRYEIANLYTNVNLHNWTTSGWGSYLLFHAQQTVPVTNDLGQHERLKCCRIAAFSGR